MTNDELKQIISVQHATLGKLVRLVESQRTALAGSVAFIETTYSTVRRAKAHADRRDRKEACRLLDLVLDNPSPPPPDFDSIEIPELPPGLLGDDQ